MSCPIYFFPRVRLDQVVKENHLVAEFLVARGVAAAFAGVRDVARQTSCFEVPGRGPGGHSGVMLTVVPDGQAPLRLGYHPEFQQWHERPAGCDCWVAIDKEHPPTPAELAHVARPQGYKITLGDGNAWCVPIVRSPFGRDDLGRSQLRRDFGYDAQGRFEVTRSSDSDALWELSAGAWDHFYAPQTAPTVELEGMVELVLAALAINYRVGKVEQQLLRLVHSSNWDDAVHAILDVPLLEEALALEKKTEPTPAVDSSKPSPGAEDTSPGTGPAGPS